MKTAFVMFVAALCLFGAVEAQKKCCEFPPVENGCACGSRVCTCDEAKGGCFCEALKVTDAPIPDVPKGDATEAAAGESGEGASGEAASAETSSAGASEELKIRKEEHACMAKAHKIKEESASLEAMKACEKATLEKSKAAGLYKKAEDSSTSGVSKAGKEEASF
jgi:hypothetical protein